MTRRSIAPASHPPGPAFTGTGSRSQASRSFRPCSLLGFVEFFPLTPGAKAKDPAAGGESQGGARHSYFTGGFKDVENYVEGDR